MPPNVKVSELAKELGMDPVGLRDMLKSDPKLRVTTIASTIPPAAAAKIRNRVRIERRRAARVDPKQAAAAKIKEQEAEREAAAERAKAKQKAREEKERAEREQEARERAAAEAAEAKRREAAEAARQAREAEERRLAEEAARQAREAEERRLAEAAEPDKPEEPAEPDRPQEPEAPARGRRLETRKIASDSVPDAFRPGATERVIEAPLTRPPARRATPPRIRATPPSLRPGRGTTPTKPARPGPGKRARSRRQGVPADTPELPLEGFDSPLPPALRQAQARKYETKAEIELGDAIALKTLADAMSIPPVEVVKRLLVEHGVMASITQLLDRDTAAKVLEGFGGKALDAAVAAGAEEETPEGPVAEGLVERAPVITVMGHVDHGKTSLLDAIRESKVVDSEAGGITQHMSAYVVQSNGHPLVFLDTPGHEAFSKMRARGANVTDAVILVVAADDGVKEQTLEALNHARAARVPIVVAVNKMDRPGADPDTVMRQLSERGLNPEEWGGDTIFCQVSAKTRDGLDDLLQSVRDVAELEEPMANPDELAHGVVLEARKDRGRGSVAQFLVQGGSLAVGDVVSAGAAWGKVRALLDDSGKRMKKAPPSTPVEVLGLSDVPVVGDPFRVTSAPAEARRIAEERQETDRLHRIEGRQRLNLASLHAQVASEGRKELPIVVKADVGGTAEAVRDSLMKLGNDEVTVTVVHAAAGAVTETDINLAAAADAVVVAFGVRPEPSAARLAEREGIEIRAHTVIYHLTEEVEKAISGMLKPQLKVVEVGKIEVRRTFQVPRVGVVAGSYVLEGSVPRSARVRLVRDGRVVHEGKIGSLRRFKDDVGRVREGFECGVGIAGYNDVKIGDIIEAFEEVPVENRALG